MDYCHKNNKKCRTIIVCFTTFRYRTQVLQAKRKMKDGVTTKVDLAKKRYNLLTVANKLVKDNDDAMCCYSDVNCRLNGSASVVMTDCSFESFEDLKIFLEEAD